MAITDLLAVLGVFGFFAVGFVVDLLLVAGPAVFFGEFVVQLIGIAAQ